MARVAGDFRLLGAFLTIFSEVECYHFRTLAATPYNCSRTVRTGLVTFEGLGYGVLPVREPSLLEDRRRWSVKDIVNSRNLNKDKLSWQDGRESHLPVDTKLVDQIALLDQTQDAIIVCNLEERIVFWNKGAERLYGWRSSEALGQNMYALLAQKRFTDSKEAEGTIVGEMRQFTKDGKGVIVESRRKLMYDDAGQAKAVLIVNTDVTEKRKLESQLFRAQRMESIERLLGGIAHDLNNVLSPMLFASSILERKCEDAEAKRLLETLRVNAEHAGRLITQLLSFAKGIDDERTSLSVGCLIEQTSQIVQSVFAKSIKLKTAIPADLWSVAGNATQLHQVLMNLCMNACDAMPNGGVLTIEAENIVLDEAGARMSSGAKPGRHIRIQVSDSGIGIPAEIVDKIFEPFFTTKEGRKGTGLGLPTVLRIVRTHQGFITVSSEPGHGAKFRIFLPAEESLQPADSTVRPVEIALTSSQRTNGASYAEYRKGTAPLQAKRQSAGGSAGAPLKG
jgi:hypothetical protein